MDVNKGLELRKMKQKYIKDIGKEEKGKVKELFT